jgi:hypothetical protein
VTGRLIPRRRSVPGALRRWVRFLSLRDLVLWRLLVRLRWR